VGGDKSVVMFQTTMLHKVDVEGSQDCKEAGNVSFLVVLHVLYMLFVHTCIDKQCTGIAVILTCYCNS